jgi:hypothetical protein
MNISSKITLYEFLSMMIPGFLLLLLIYSSCCLEHGKCYVVYEHAGNAFFIFALSIVSYLIGMVYHKIVEFLFSIAGFRNDLSNIQRMGEKVKCDYEKDGGRNHCITEYSRYNYYKAYYYLIEKKALYNIPALEAQVAFIRNILPIIPMYIIALCCYDGWISGFVESVQRNTSGLAIGLFVIEISLIVVMHQVQQKIYYLVWEGYTYLKDLGNKITDNTNSESNSES